MIEKKADVFADLLGAWRENESKIISEWSFEIDADEQVADRKETDWLVRYEEAET